MKRHALTMLVVLGLLLAISFQAQAQNEVVHKKISDNRSSLTLPVAGKEVSINYGTPAWGAEDRLAQAPDGFIWRLGMNEPTVLNTGITLAFGEKTLPAGKYALAMRHVTGDNWELLVNSEIPGWGGPNDRSKDVAVVPMTMKKVDDVAKVLKLDIIQEMGSGGLAVMWGPYVVSTGFSVRQSN